MGRHKEDTIVSKEQLANKDMALEYYRKIAAYILICTGNKSEAYRFYMLHTSANKELTKQDNRNVNAWLNTAAMQNTLRYLRDEVEEKIFLSYCNKKGYSATGIIQGASVGLSKKQAEENDRTLLRSVIKQRFEDQYHAATEAGNFPAAIQAMKEMTALMDAKYKEEEINKEKAFITYYLPADICENCPNRAEVESKYSAEEEKQVEIAEIITEDDENITVDEIFEKEIIIQKSNDNEVNTDLL